MRVVAIMLGLLLTCTVSTGAQEEFYFGAESKYRKDIEKINEQRNKVCSLTEVKRMLVCHIRYGDIRPLRYRTFLMELMKIRMHRGGDYKRAKELQLEVDANYASIADSLAALKDEFEFAWWSWFTTSELD